MSALARYFKANGKNVAGYDKTKTPITNDLVSLGIAIHFEDRVENIPKEFLLKEKTIFWILAMISFAVVVLRAIYVPMFHDEIVTFNHYIKSGILSPFSEYRAANNHLTNSVISRFFYLLFGDYPLSLRLTNVLFFIPYCYFLYQLGKKIASKTIKWGFYLAFLFSFQFVAFFALSRGYGIALASVLASIYFLGNLIQRVEVKTLFFTIIFLLLGLFAFFSLLAFCLVLISIFR